jgi:hypothetical protein
LTIQSKKILIGGIYLIIFSPLLFFAYGLFVPKETCFDGKKNQNEQGEDCGGICEKACDLVAAQNLKVLEAGSAPSGFPGKVDFFAKVENPNAVFGNKKFNYKVIVSDGGGDSREVREGSSFILPGEKKYIVEPGIDLSEISGGDLKFDLKIIDSEWIVFDDQYEKPELQVVNKSYSQIVDGVGFSEARGLLKNRSPYDFEVIKIQILLKDDQGKTLAINSTQMKTVKSGEERDFRVFWPASFPGTVRQIEVQPEVNVSDSAAFFERYYQTEKFQSYE